MLRRFIQSGLEGLTLGPVLLAALILGTLLGAILGTTGCGGGSSKPRLDPPVPNPAFCAGSRPMSPAEAALCREARDCLLGNGFAISATLAALLPAIVVNKPDACGNGRKACCVQPRSPIHASWGPIGSEYVPECNPDLVSIGAYVKGSPCSQAYWNTALKHECGHFFGLDPNHTHPLWPGCKLMPAVEVPYRPVLFASMPTPPAPDPSPTPEEDA